jgi:Flp pilus assembly protein TadB
MELVLATAALLIGSAVYSTLAFRSTKSMRRGSDEELRRQWRALDRDRRKSINGSLRRGEAVRDQEDADLALRVVAQVERVRRSLRTIELVSWVMFLVLLVALIVLDHTTLAVGLGVVLAIFALLTAFSAWHWRRLRRAAAATRHLANR